MGICIASYIPSVSWVPQYRSRFLLADIVAGLTVGFMVIPQALAYAAVAELPVFNIVDHYQYDNNILYYHRYNMGYTPLFLESLYTVYLARLKTCPSVLRRLCLYLQPQLAKGMSQRL